MHTLSGQILTKKTDFILIAPPEIVFYGMGPNFASMGVFSLLTYLHSHGFSGNFVNANYLPKIRTYKKTLAEKMKGYSNAVHFWEDLEHPRWQALFNVIVQDRPKVVGITCLDADIYPAKVIAKKTKELLPGSTVVVGGPTPSVYPEIFADCPEIDFLAQGEGEKTLLEIVQASVSGNLRRDIPGTCYFSGGELVHNEARPCVGETEGLDSLPLVEREFLYFDPITYEVKQDVQLDGLLTSRGCAHNCRFCCSAGIWKQKIYYRGIDSVCNEMVTLRKKYGNAFDNFYIHDDNFPSSIKRVREFSQKVSALDERFQFRCFSRVRPLKNEEIIYSLIRAGCTEFLIGVESGSDYVLETMGKQLTVAESAQVGEVLNAYEMLWRAFFIMGSPYERLEDIQKTVDFVKALKAPIGRIYHFYPYLGSEFFHDLPNLGIKIELASMLRENQEVTKYIGNLIPQDVYNRLYLEAEAAAFENNKAWEAEFILDEPRRNQAIALEQETVEFFCHQSELSGLIIGAGRNIRWLAALLHVSFQNHEFAFFDADKPGGWGLHFAQFISATALSSYKGKNVYTIGTPPEGSCNSFGRTLPVEGPSGPNHPKRRVCEILFRTF